MSQVDSSVTVSMQVAEVLNGVRDLEVEVAKISTRLDGVNSRLDSVSSRLDKVENTVDKMRYELLAVAIGAPATISIMVGIVVAVLKLTHVV